LRNPKRCLLLREGIRIKDAEVQAGGVLTGQLVKSGEQTL
jgi:hypothetical protein